MDELMQLQLHESLCLPSLQYVLCAVRLTSSQCGDLNVCCNTVFTYILQFRKHGSPSEFICELGRLNFRYLCIYLSLKCVNSCLYSKNGAIMGIGRLPALCNELTHLCYIV